MKGRSTIFEWRLCLRILLVLALVPLFMVGKSVNVSAQSPKKTQIIDRAYFFKNFRQKFHRKITDEQVAGYNHVMDYWDKRDDLTDLRWLAYALATAYHETGRRLVPVRECFGKNDAASIACVTRLYRRGRIKRNYARIDPKTGKSYFGRGHVQLTHAYNYKNMGREIGVNDKLYVNPSLALDKANSTEIMFLGMIKGIYTGKKLRQYFNNTRTDWGGARRIINGLDKHKLIAGHGRKFYSILKLKPITGPEPDDCDSAIPPSHCYAELKAQLAKLTGDFEGLKKQNAALVKSNDEVLKNFEELSQQNQQLNQEYEKLKTQFANLETSHNKLNQNHEQLKTETESLKTQNQNLTDKNAELQKKIDELLAAGHGNDDEQNETIRQRLAELDKQLKDLKDKQAIVVNKERDLDLAKSEFAQKEQQLSTRELNFAEKETKLKALQEDIEISKHALQSREITLLKDLKNLQTRENDISVKTEENLNKLAQLERYREELEAKEKALEEKYSRNWFTRTWDSIASTWRDE